MPSDGSASESNADTADRQTNRLDPERVENDVYFFAIYSLDSGRNSYCVVDLGSKTGVYVNFVTINGAYFEAEDYAAMEVDDYEVEGDTIDLIPEGSDE